MKVISFIGREKKKALNSTETGQDAANIVKSKIPSAKIVNEGEHWRPFKGGASAANQSHWFVKFII